MSTQMSLTEHRWTIPQHLAPIQLGIDKYRYLFGWIWNRSRPLVLYVGLNPSSMQKETTDHTGRKWRGFADRWGMGGYLAVNPFAYRATNPKDLLRALNSGVDVVGILNDTTIKQAVHEVGDAGKVVVCWGDPPSQRLDARLSQVLHLLKSEAKSPIMCFGKTAWGRPKHPLMLPWSTKLEVA